MAAAYSFRPRAWAFALAAAGCAAGIALGNWQAGRAEQKRVVGQRLEAAHRAAPLEIGPQLADPAQISLKRVAARGRFVAEHTVFLANKLRDGRPGYEVITPLALNGVHVLVNRGWVAAPTPGAAPPEVPTPPGEQRVEGIALERLPRVLILASRPAGRVRQSLELDAFSKETGLPLLPVVIEQHSAAPDGLQRRWPRPDAGIEKHQAYALQWYSLGALAVVLFLALSFRRVGAP